MELLQVIRKMFEEHRNKKKRIKELADAYVDMFLEQIEKKKIDATKERFVPTTVTVELVQNRKDGTISNRERSEKFNIEALLMAEKRLAKDYRAEACNDHYPPFAYRLTGKVTIW